MLLSLLFIIILAAIAYQSKRILLSAVLFGALKAIASCFYAMAESEMGYGSVALLATWQFLANGLIGCAIAALIVRNKQSFVAATAMTALVVLTYLTAGIDPLIAGSTGEAPTEDVTYAPVGNQT